MNPSGNDAILAAVHELDNRIDKERERLDKERERLSALERVRRDLLDIAGGDSGTATPGGQLLYECPFSDEEMAEFGDERLIARRIAEQMPDRTIHLLTTTRHIRNAGCSERSEDALRTHLGRYMDSCDDWSASVNGRRTLVGASDEASEIAESSGRSSHQDDGIDPPPSGAPFPPGPEGT